jgi:hypothetical protein
MQQNRSARLVLAAVLFSFAAASLNAQGRGGGRGAGGRGGDEAPKTPKSEAPFDITGYWISVVAEDWRYRMVTPLKGDYQGVPLNAEGKKVADAWDPAKDEAASEQCKSYGAASIMRVPGRLHITWQDDQTIKMEADAGTQTRTFYFGTPQSRGGDWQGVSKAEWEFLKVGGFGFNPFGNAPGGSLKVMTKQLKPGYLRKNGVPYSANTTVTEYFDRVDEPTGEAYLVVIMTVEDPLYLNGPYATSFHFRKQPDASGWNPTPCTSK